MKSTRATVKVQPALPFSSVTATRHHRPSFLSRVARTVTAAAAAVLGTSQPSRAAEHAASDATESAAPFAGSAGKESSSSSSSSASTGAASAAGTPPLLPGDVLRDVAFFAHAFEVTYFSSHPSLCADIFGFVPGEVLELMRECGGDILGRLVVVVGARGGKLWVLSDQEEVARVLHIPPVHPAELPLSSSSTSTSTSVSRAAQVRAAVLAHYDAQLVFHPHRSLTAEEAERKRRLRGILLDPKMVEEQGAEIQAAQQAELKDRIDAIRAAYADLRAQAAEKATHVYSAEQRAFLQRAPDLYVAAAPVAAYFPQPIAPASRHRPSQVHEHADAAEHHHHHHQHFTLEDSTASASTAGACAAATSAYAAVACGVAEARAVVVLPPRVMAATGTVGWTGEDDVMLVVPGGEAGASSNLGSLSATVVI